MRLIHVINVFLLNKEFFQNFILILFTLGTKKVNSGDLTSRKQLKKNLKCKDFRWYLENVYPESNMAKEFIAFGEVSLIQFLLFEFFFCFYYFLSCFNKS